MYFKYVIPMLNNIVCCGKWHKSSYGNFDNINVMPLDSMSRNFYRNCEFTVQILIKY